MLDNTPPPLPPSRHLKEKFQGSVGKKGKVGEGGELFAGQHNTAFVFWPEKSDKALLQSCNL